jgi:diguanylate cyclase (GGDEF)-like protein
MQNGVTIKFTVSVGVSTLSSDLKTTEELIYKADKALYQAKNSGRNKVCTYNA